MAGRAKSSTCTGAARWNGKDALESLRQGGWEAEKVEAMTGKAKKATAGVDGEVDAFMAKLNDPRKAEIEAIRRAILAANPEIREGIKWNAPSFRVTDYFATTNLNPKGGVRLILHTGAKVKASGVTGEAVADPMGLLQWLAKDRAMVTFDGVADVAGKRAALQAIVKAWIKLL